jgi:hypothetical protein
MDEILNTSIKYRGLDLSVKSVKKEYPFIKDWKLNENYLNYKNVLFLDFEIDWIKLSEYSGYPVNHTYLKRIISTSSLGIFYNLKEENPIDVGVAEDEKFEYFYGLKMSINDMLQRMYKSLPDKMVIKWEEDGFQDIIVTPIAQDFF